MVQNVKKQSCSIVARKQTHAERQAWTVAMANDWYIGLNYTASGVVHNHNGRNCAMQHATDDMHKRETCLSLQMLLN